MAMTVQQVQLYLYLCIGIIVIVFFRLRSFLPAWLDVMRSFGSKYLVLVRNDTQDYFVSGRTDKSFLYIKRKSRKDNTKPTSMISITNTWNPKTGKIDKAFSFPRAVRSAFGVRYIEVDDKKDCIIFYDEGEYGAIPGTNTELMDEHLNTAMNKPSRMDGFMDNKRFQIFVFIILGLIVIGIIYLIMSSKDANLMTGLIETNGLVKDIHEVSVGNFTG